jgi:hypothetical protein
MRARKRRAKRTLSNRSRAKRPVRQKTFIDKKSARADVANAMSSTPDGFGPWFAEQSGRLPPDFELDI